MHAQRELIVILDKLLDGLLIAQLGQIVYANPAVCNLFALSEDELIQQNLSQLFTQDIPLTQSTDEPWTKVQLNIKQSDKPEVLVKISDCSWREQTAKLLQIRQKTDHSALDQNRLEKEVYKRTHILHDALAQYKESGKTLKGAKEVAEQANQGKNQFLRIVGHEFNSPLNSILGFADLLKYDIPRDNTSWHNSLDEIVVAARRLHDSIRDIQFVANLELGLINQDINEVDIAALMDSCIGNQDNQEGIKISHCIPEHLACMADANHLRKVINILLENGIRYNKENGELLVTTQIFDKKVRISFADTGKGIEKKYLDNIFLPFQHQMYRHPNSKGVGLALAKALCDAMHANIGVFSEIGKGSTFWLELDVVEKQQAKPMKDAPDSRDTVSLLYIDDHIPNLKLLSYLCKKLENYTVYTTHDPIQGLELAKTIRPNIILLDIQIPHIDGYELARQIKAIDELKNTPIIAVSAGPLSLDKHFDSFLHKPIDLKRLKRLLQQFSNLKEDEHQ